MCLPTLHPTTLEKSSPTEPIPRCQERLGTLEMLEMDQSHRTTTFKNPPGGYVGRLPGNHIPLLSCQYNPNFVQISKSGTFKKDKRFPPEFQHWLNWTTWLIHSLRRASDRKGVTGAGSDRGDVRRNLANVTGKYFVLG